ncbi:hypothetical protein GTY73_06640 [Streptomyces sp. SID8354]|nr:hypothetical protein [Streptomyces sp. SID8354]
MSGRISAPADRAGRYRIRGAADAVLPLVVVRDAARHGWMCRALAGLTAARPDAVVVEVGLPGDALPGAGRAAASRRSPGSRAPTRSNRGTGAGRTRPTAGQRSGPGSVRNSAWPQGPADIGAQR